MNELAIENKPNGYLEVIVGPMFSGKTSRIINLYKQYKYCNIPVIVVNHNDDNRYDNELLSNHDNIKIACFKCYEIKEMIAKYYTLLNTQHVVILINEGQFFDDLYDSVSYLVNDMDKCVYVCGLDGDFKSNKFGQILDLIPICDNVYKLHSICVKCKNGKRAIFTNRKTNDKEQKLIGVDTYEPLCRKCYFHTSIENSTIASESQDTLALTL
jgi:thymidine kinase